MATSILDLARFQDLFFNAGKLFLDTEYFKFDDGKIKETECSFGSGVNYPNHPAKYTALKMSR